MVDLCRRGQARRVHPPTPRADAHLEDGEILIESNNAILDHLDALAQPDRRLLPAFGEERRAALKTCALATGLCDKMVSLVYARVMHAETSNMWVARCTSQMSGVLAMLKPQCPALATPF